LKSLTVRPKPRRTPRIACTSVNAFTSLGGYNVKERYSPFRTFVVAGVAVREQLGEAAGRGKMRSDSGKSGFTC